MNAGFGDDEKGFYAVYKEVFNSLAAEDAEFMDGSDDEEEIPSFGKSDDDYEGVVGPFYAYWSVYSTSRSYSWLDKYDTRQGENRYKYYYLLLIKFTRFHLCDECVPLGGLKERWSKRTRRSETRKGKRGIKL